MHKREHPIEGREPGPEYYSIRVGKHAPLLFSVPHPIKAAATIRLVQSQQKALKSIDTGSSVGDLATTTLTVAGIQGSVIGRFWADPVWEPDFSGETAADKGLALVEGMADAGWSSAEIDALYQGILGVLVEVQASRPDGAEVDRLVDFGRGGTGSKTSSSSTKESDGSVPPTH